jgi:hypothetical protein
MKIFIFSKINNFLLDNKEFVSEIFPEILFFIGRIAYSDFFLRTLFITSLNVLHGIG